MKKKNLVTLLGIALVVAIISTGVFYGLFVSKLKSDTGKTLVVAARSLEAGTVLAAADLKTISWSAQELPQGSFERTDQVAGKTLFTSIGPSEPILAARLASEDGSGQGGAGIPAGMRAISVHVSDSSGVLNLLHAGHKVDVQVLIPRTNTTGPQLRTAVQDLTVLMLDSKPEPNSQGFSLPVVTLLAKPEDADILGLADSGARVRLTLRNPLDTATRSSNALTLPTVMQR